MARETDKDGSIGLQRHNITGVIPCILAVFFSRSLIKHLFFVIILTAITQVGGLIWILSIWVSKLTKKRKRYVNFFENDPTLSLVSGVKEFIQFLYQNDITLVLASSSAM